MKPRPWRITPRAGFCVHPCGTRDSPCKVFRLCGRTGCRRLFALGRSRRLTFGFPHALADALDRVGEDVQELLRLLLVDDQRRDDADDLVARPGADEEGAVLLGAADDLLGGGTVRR